MKLNIEIDEFARPLLTIHRDNGTKKKVETDLSSILKLFEESFDVHVEETNRNFERKKKTAEPLTFQKSSILPKNTVKYARRKALSKDDTEIEYIAIAAPEFNSSFAYNGTMFNNVAFPNLVFFFEIQNHLITNKYVTCYKSRTIRDNTPLFAFPYAHVYDSTSICYYDRNEVNDLVELEGFPYNWSHVAMGDHFYKRKKANGEEYDLRLLLELMSDGAKFDYDLLSPHHYTFGEWFDRLVGPVPNEPTNEESQEQATQTAS